MHDINRTQLETEWETGLADEYAYQESEYEYEDMEDEYEHEYEEPEYESYGAYESYYGEQEGPLDEADEMELAAQLLEVTDEQELDRFIGKIFKKVKNVIGKALPPGVPTSLGGFAKALAKKALPMVGNFVAPGIGGVVGGQLAQAFELELEGLSAEDQEFEIARHYVRLVSDAAQEAANIPPTVPPQVAANQAVKNSVAKHAPGLLPGSNGQSPMQQQRKGQNRNPNVRRRRTRMIQIRPGDKFIKLTIERG